MKKLLSLFLTLCMLLSAVSVLAVNVSAADGALTPDTTWYTDHKEETDLYIDDAADLLGFAALLAGQIENDAVLADAAAEAKIFTGKTVRLRADIDLNPGWIAGSRTEAIGDAQGQLIVPANVWAAVNGHGFTGMFDGDGHTVSGLYFASEGKNTGIFGNPRCGTEAAPVGVKKLAIVNSYISTTDSEFGALFGATSNFDADKQDNANVLVENVYLDVTMYTSAPASPGTNDGRNTGGVIGAVFSECTLTIRNTVVNNTIEAAKTIRTAAGFIGLATCAGGKVEKDGKAEGERNCYVTIEDSLFSGVLNNKNNQNAGYVARASSYLTINRCIEAGDVYPATWTTDTKFTGSMIGWSIYPNNRITNCLYTDVFYVQGGKYTPVESLYGTAVALGNPILENNTHVTDAELTGIAAAEKLALAGMGATWTPTTTGLPLPRKVAELFGETVIAKKDAAATPVVKLAGYQTTDTKDGKLDLRLVAALKLPEGKTTADFTAVGFTVVANYGTTSLTKDYGVDTVYTSVAAYTKGGAEVKAYTAAELGGDYLFVLPCRNVPADAGTVTLEVTVYYATAEQTVVGATKVITIDPANSALS